MYSDPNRNLKSIFFTPEQVSVVALAFDSVCKDLQIELSSTRAREIVAQQVIGKARANFPDADKIRAATLGALGLSAERFMNPLKFSSIFSDL